MKVSTRVIVYVIGNALITIAMVVAAATSGGGGHVLYLSALTALCSSPLLWLDRLNGRYLLLASFTPLYFLLFGMLELVQLLTGNAADGDREGVGLSVTEWGLLLGLVCFLAGYLAAARGRSAAAGRLGDWPQLSVLIVGLALWLSGTAALIYYQVFLAPDKTAASAGHGLAVMGPTLTFFVMLGNLVGHLGLLILAYGYARYGTPSWLLVAVLMLAAQFVTAFLTNIRGEAVTPFALLVISLMLIRNKLPATWLAVAIVSVGLMVPILGAYRAAVTGGGISRKEALDNIEKVIKLVEAYQERTAGTGRGPQTLFHRAYLKGNVELIITRTGVDVPFQSGGTLLPIPLAFIPRLLYPDKPDIPVGLLFNHQFFPRDPVSEDTYISPSGIGELYWNFGWPGLVIGMSLMGALMGYVGRKCDLSEEVSVTRILVQLATVQCLCVGFEGAMSVSYILWLRSIGVIGLMQLLLARRGAPAALSVPVTLGARTERRGPRFQNVMP
jgi:hypothetical protein